MDGLVSTLCWLVQIKLLLCFDVPFYNTNNEYHKKCDITIVIIKNIIKT